MPSLLSFHDQQHITRMFVQEQRVNMIFNQFVSSIAPEMRKWKDAGNKNSVWVRNPGIEKAIDKCLVQLQSNLEKEIKSGQTKAWNEAVLKNDKMVEGYIKGMSLSTIVKEGLFRRNLDALELLQNRTENGLNISQRVWNIADQTKGHVELFLEGGISTGRSADQISRDFRQLLNNPDKRFRRVRDKEGKLVPSQPMKDYHPGPGVYRSSKMNAIRVSATETNMGYRMSDCERWNQLHFVLGFEVKRSRNGHPCAICDALVGKYPKDFVFPGWHPFCICIAVPIVLEHKDFADFLLTDQISDDKYIRTIPSNAMDWMTKYTEKTGSVPYFVKQNSSYITKDTYVVAVNPNRVTLDQLNKLMGDKYPNTLKNLGKKIDEYESDWSKEQQAEALKKIEEVLSNGNPGMNVPANAVDGIFKSYFKSQIETGTGKGYVNIDYRKKASNELFGTNTQVTKAREYEKYGFLMDKDILKQAESGIAGQYWSYGDGIQVRFKKDKVIATFTTSDSLGSELVPSLVTDPKISSIYKWNDGLLHKKANHTDIIESTGAYASQYIELQYHGMLTIDCVESVFIPEKVIAKLKKSTFKVMFENKITAYTKVSGKLVTLNLKEMF